MEQSETWVPIFIAACALVVSIWAMWTQRKHNRLSVVPHIDVGLSENHLFIENNGLGPARITSFEGTVGDTPYDLGLHLLAAACAMDLLQGQPIPDHVIVGSIPASTHLRAGDQTTIYLSKASEPEELLVKAAKRLALRVEYESIFGQSQEPCCWGPNALGDLSGPLEELLKRDGGT